jgi:hypothetical protein
MIALCQRCGVTFKHKGGPAKRRTFCSRKCRWTSIPPGRRFHDLVVVADLGVSSKRRLLRVRCDCGAEKTMHASNVLAGYSKTCGCATKESTRRRNATWITHGHTRQVDGTSSTPTYRSWLSMKARCSNPKSPNWLRYGGRGIAVCSRWQQFENFSADMGERPPGKTLDRSNNDLGYFPSNCRWATPKEQAANRSNSKRRLTTLEVCGTASNDAPQAPTMTSETLRSAS